MIMEKQIVAMRGRNPDNPSDRRAGIQTEQRLEPNTQGISNTLTCVQKDNLVIEKEVCALPEARLREYTLCYDLDDASYFIRIRRLSPLECWRLMDFSDEDFHKAERKVSRTQLYKQAGNSIVKNVLIAIIGQFFEGCENAYKR